MASHRSLRITTIFLLAAIAACAPAPAPESAGGLLDVVGRSAAELQEAMSAGELSSESLTEGCLARIQRIGVVRSLAGYHSGVDQLLEAALEELEAAGAEIVDELSLEPPEGFGQATYDLLLYEFKHDLNAYLAGLPDPVLSALTLESLIAFNEQHTLEEMPHFGQEIFLKAQAKGPLTEPAYLEALALVERATREDGIDPLIREHKLDALLAPTGAPAWKIDLIDGDHFLGGSSTYPAVAGYPNITVPMGQVQGMPVGLSFFGPALSEPTLIEIAYGYEQATRHRISPRRFMSNPG